MDTIQEEHGSQSDSHLCAMRIPYIPSIPALLWPAPPSYPCALPSFRILLSTHCTIEKTRNADPRQRIGVRVTQGSLRIIRTPTSRTEGPNDSGIVLQFRQSVGQTSGSTS